MVDIKIVEYNTQYAAALAEMWNKSGENWGGESVMRTAESVIAEEANNSNLKTFLALHEQKVVGYCSFSNYKEDEGASYIPLLNVQPDYHGNKVGKKLVLKCVEEAIKAEWPRLDLYTWQGNEKAVPLYKKCGFFWEKEDKYTHLMNFLPYVKKTEAVAEYFDNLDWYQDSTREIKVESDGDIEGDFHFYNYSWQKNDVVLKMEFERRGRGLTCIETNDYLIKARLKEQNLIFGREYDITYELVNKSGKPLNINIKGVNNKNIKYNADLSFSVVDNQSVTSRFHVEPIKELQQDSKTHPCVVSSIEINGKVAEFKLGVSPKRPIELKIANEAEAKLLNQNNICYFNFENNFKEEIEISFDLVNTKCVSFINPKLTFKLESKQKKSIAVDCIVKEYGFYDEDLEISIKTKSNVITYLASCKAAFRGYSGVYYGETDTAYNLYNGAYCASLLKEGNATQISKLGIISQDKLNASIPKFGKPYYDEFKSKKPNKIEFISKANSQAIKASFESEKFTNVTLHYYIELFQEGIVELYSEIENKGSSKDLYIAQDCRYLFMNSYLPYNGEIVHSAGFEGLLLKQWNIENFNECWAFNNRASKTGISWPSGCNVSFDYVTLLVETKVTGSIIRTKPVIYSLDTFNTWNQFRDYLGYKKPLSNSDVNDGFTCKVNNNNPFIANSVILECEEQKNIDMKAKLSYSSKNNSLKEGNVELKFNNNRAILNKTVNSKPELDILKLNFSSLSKDFSQEKLLFFKGQQPVQQKKYTALNNTVYEVSNEYITIKSSPEYSSGIYSLCHKGVEWFANSFPTPSIKGWWNFWTGGTSIMPGGMSFASVNKEQKSADFVKVNDIHGNEWQGIKTSLKITENEKFKGITINEYYLLMSGVPLVCSFAVVNQNSGKYFNSLAMFQRYFIQQGELTDNSVVFTENGNSTEYKCGNSQWEVPLNNTLLYKSKTAEYSLYRVINNQALHWIDNTNLVTFSGCYSSHSVNDGENFTTKPQFMLFSKENLSDDVLNDLNKLKFKI